ncbi:hypothetical protein, partial [Xanthomonas arboricola]|uniref:hypothetical protein n=1 Tax=Xanthomonas arboricola TaxID=56448 RepID=UPI001955A94B
SASVPAMPAPARTRRRVLAVFVSALSRQGPLRRPVSSPSAAGRASRHRLSRYAPLLDAARRLRRRLLMQVRAAHLPGEQAASQNKALGLIERDDINQ